MMDLGGRDTAVAMTCEDKSLNGEELSRPGFLKHLLTSVETCSHLINDWKPFYFLNFFFEKYFCPLKDKL